MNGFNVWNPSHGPMQHPRSPLRTLPKWWNISGRQRAPSCSSSGEVGRPWLKCLGNLGPCQSWFLKSQSLFGLLVISVVSLQGLQSVAIHVFMFNCKVLKLHFHFRLHDTSVSGLMATALFLAAACHCSRLWADSGGVVGRTSPTFKTFCGYPIFKFVVYLPKWFAEYFIFNQDI